MPLACRFLSPIPKSWYEDGKSINVNMVEGDRLAKNVADVLQYANMAKKGLFVKSVAGRKSATVIVTVGAAPERASAAAAG